MPNNAAHGIGTMTFKVVTEAMEDFVMRLDKAEATG